MEILKQIISIPSKMLKQAKNLGLGSVRTLNAIWQQGAFIAASKPGTKFENPGAKKEKQTKEG